MADFIMFTEGKNELLNNGLPATCTFDLSTKDCATFLPGDTFAGGYSVVTGTGYAAQTETEPTASGGQVTFAQKTWSTGSAVNWPAAVKSVVLRTGTKLICAWNLQPGGTARDMSTANTTENVTPTLTL